MWEPCQERHWSAVLAGSWQNRVKSQLKGAYRQFQVWCKQKSISTSQSCFTDGRISMTTLTECPCLKAKAANCLNVCRWLTEVTSSQTHSEMAQVRACCWWEFCQAITILQGEPMWVRDGAIAPLQQAHILSLNSYNWLSWHCGQQGIHRYPSKPKQHMYDHCLRDVMPTRVNAVWHLCFSDEDFIGKMKRIAAGTHFQTMGERCLERWCMRYFANIR